MPSQSGDGPNGGGLSPIDDDHGHRGEIRSSSRYGGEYGVSTTSGHFCDRSKFDGNIFPEPPSKGKGKKHTSIGYSFGRRSSSSNLRYSDSSTSVMDVEYAQPMTLAHKVFIHRTNIHIFNIHLVIHNHMVIIHYFLIMVCHISLTCILQHQCITHLHLSC
ncbi:hypothetical protein Golax_016886, partial [Gossypium laxum]|nr:hypothetical protein [Gossypium laxum]